MFNFKWQKETVSEQQVAVMAPRQAGKTYAAMQWAMQPGDKVRKKVLYVVSNARMVAHVVQAFHARFPDGARVVQPSSGLISYHNGITIHVVAGRNERSFRGYEVDAVVIDDADYIPEDSFQTAIMCCPSRNVFVGCTNPNRGAAKLIERFERIKRVIIPGETGDNVSYKFLLDSEY